MAAGFGTDDFSLEGDWLFDFTTFDETKSRAGLGGELLLANHYPIRLGYKYDQGLDNHALSFGLGYLAREFSADFSLRRAVAGEKYTAIFFGLKYHLESAGIGKSAPY